MTQEVTFVLLMVLVVGLLIHAYNMGWESGHDAHHTGKPKPPKKGKGPSPLWQ